MLCAYCYSHEHVTEDYPNLLKKWEDKKTNYNMVHVEPHKNKNKNEEADVRVVTRGGEKTWVDFEHGEGSGQQPDGKIRKAPQPPPKFNVAQQKQFLRDAQRALKEERAREELQCATQKSLEEA
jgi:hypothetical protein